MPSAVGGLFGVGSPRGVYGRAAALAGPVVVVGGAPSMEGGMMSGEGGAMCASLTFSAGSADVLFRAVIGFTVRAGGQKAVGLPCSGRTRPLGPLQPGRLATKMLQFEGWVKTNTYEFHNYGGVELHTSNCY